MRSELPAHPEVVTSSLIQTITSGDRKGRDTIHLLVMDLHKALNSLQANISVEDIDGAKVFRLNDVDKKLVSSFMSGVNRTSPLKFEHPGLGTTATRNGERLILQNDIGETGAHLMIVQIKEMEASIVQTDVHLPRVLFFQSLFDRWGVVWQDTMSRTEHRGTLEEGVYHLSRGTYKANDLDQLGDFLEFLGSRIVFLIDWNRARKKLQSFLPKKDAIGVLRWAAENEVGHRGFLKLGGDQLIFEALELAPRVPLRYGQPLYQVLGKDQTITFFRSALQRSARELLDQRSIRLIQDEIKAELINHFRPAPQELLTLCIKHATLIFEVATTLHRTMNELEQGGSFTKVKRDADRTKRWEKEADEIVSRVRTLARTIEEAIPFVDLVINADDALDYLEEAMYLMTLVPSKMEMGRSFVELGTMTDISLESCQELIKSLYVAERNYGRYSQIDISDFLHAVDGVIELEERCDLALRRSMATIMDESHETKGAILTIELARNIEESTNSMMKVAYVLKDNVFESVGTFEVR